MITTDAAPKRTHNEDLKEGNPLLTGTIAQNLADPATDLFTHDDYEFLKFHGIYQQDDRDLRKTGKKYIFMARVRMPGGILSAEQYLVLDRLATELANNTLRVTSRQGIQFHGVIKSNLSQVIKGINQTLLTTMAACGDVARNVMASPTPATSPLIDRVQQDAHKLSKALLPQTHAYHEIWLAGQTLDLTAPRNQNFEDPLYGKTYLPRKFKVAFAIPPLNDVDVLTNCLGFIAIAENGELAGYNLAVGGGQGKSHGNEATYPRVADVVGFFTPEHLETVAKAVLAIHKEFGDRSNRKHARLKYVVAEKGVEWFRAEFEKRVGFKLADPRPFEFTKQGDTFGWHQQLDGKWFLGLHAETGRIKDAGDRRLKTALRVVVEKFRPELRMTPANSLLLVNLEAEARAPINRILAEHGVPVEKQGSPLRLASMACVAYPTCGLALAESERYLPDLITRIDQLLEETGLAGEEIVIRMTGCPNGCARPYMAEIGFVGRAPGRYQIYLGGNLPSTRLNRLYKDNVKDAEIIAELRPLLLRYRAERQPGERFGDWTARTLWTS